MTNTSSTPAPKLTARQQIRVDTMVEARDAYAKAIAEKKADASLWASHELDEDLTAIGDALTDAQNACVEAGVPTDLIDSLSAIDTKDL